MCDYCGETLPQQTYFCQACTKPYKAIETLLARSLPVYLDDEMRVRNSTKAWNMFFYFLGALILGYVVGVITSDGDQGMVSLVGSIFLMVTALVFLLIEWADVRPQLARTGLGLPAVWFGMLVLVPMLLLNYYYHGLFESLIPQRENEKYNEIIDSRFGLILLICVFPAICEEIAFRGIIQNEFEKTLTPKKAIFVASCLFSVMHFTILSAPYLLLVGCLLGWLRWRSASLYPPITAHFLHNYAVITYFN